MKSAISNQPAENLSQLLSLYDKVFVRCAYLTLLGREPDSEGLQTYCQKIRFGERKIAILSQLHQSAEGRAFAAELPGLSKALAMYRRSRLPVIGRLYLTIRKADGDSALERKLRSIENAIYANGYELFNRIERLDAMVASRAVAPGIPHALPPVQEQKVVSPATAKPAKGGFIPA